MNKEDCKMELENLDLQLDWIYAQFDMGDFSDSYRLNLIGDRRSELLKILAGE